MKVILGVDHAGFLIKEKLKLFFDKKGISYEDCGAYDKNSVDDFVDYASLVAKKIQEHPRYMGILICGTGTGMVIAANKFKSIRAVVAYDAYSAKMSRHDNNANVLALRGRYFPYAKIEKIVDIWLKTPFSGLARHKRRINKVNKLL